MPDGVSYFCCLQAASGAKEEAILVAEGGQMPRSDAGPELSTVTLWRSYIMRASVEGGQMPRSDAGAKPSTVTL